MPVESSPGLPSWTSLRKISWINAKSCFCSYSRVLSNHHMTSVELKSQNADTWRVPWCQKLTTLWLPSAQQKQCPMPLGQKQSDFCWALHQLSAWSPQWRPRENQVICRILMKLGAGFSFSFEVKNLNLKMKMNICIDWLAGIDNFIQILYARWITSDSEEVQGFETKVSANKP